VSDLAERCVPRLTRRYSNGIVRRVFNSQLQATKHVDEALSVLKRLSGDTEPVASGSCLSSASGLVRPFAPLVN
jgi:hypothetical protein